MMTDPVGDLLTRIRNGQSARLESVTVPASRLRSNVLDVLQREGYIRGWFEEELRPGVKELRVELKYDNGRPVIKEIKRVSTPGRRVYSKIRELPRHFNGLGISILSTPRGVMSDAEARAAQVGDKLVFAPRSDSRRARMQWGTARNLASNVVRGVSDGFTVKLEINGVGYRAQADGKVLKLQLGYSHDVEVAIPAGIEIKALRPTEVEISGADRQKVGQLAAEIRSLRPPEPDKGKGIKYSTETIRRKEGKKK